MGLSVSAGFSSYERVSELVEEKACIAKWTDAPMRGLRGIIIKTSVRKRAAGLH
jgi:hypothetical protein